MLSLDLLPPGRREDAPRSRALLFSLLLHAAPALCLIIPALMPSGSLPVQAGGALTVSLGTPQAGGAEMKAGMQMPGQPGNAASAPPSPSASREKAQEAEPEPALRPETAALPVREKKSRAAAPRRPEKKVKRNAAAPGAGTAKSAPPRSDAPPGASDAKDGSGEPETANAAGGAGGAGPSQARVMAWNAGGGPRFVRQAPLRYPRAARRRNLEGKAVVEVHLDAQGKLLRARVVQADHEAFGSAALACVRASTFASARVEGRNVPCVARIPMLFVLRE